MLQKRGMNTKLLATDQAVVEFARQQGIDVWDFQGIQRAVNPVRDFFTILNLAVGLRGRFDIVHTNTTKGGAIGRLAAWLAHVPIVVHTVMVLQFMSSAENWPLWRSRLLKTVCQRCVTR